MTLRVLAFLLLAVAARAGDLSIVHVYTGWRDAASFKRISEYFDGKENTGGEAVLRTQPNQRAGFYFLVRVHNAGAARPVQAKLQLVLDGNSKPVAHAFTVALKDKDTVFHLGLTGSDWNNPNGHPVARKLELTDPEGHALATETSYLWEKPATN